jgi:hypothetical protein
MACLYRCAFEVSTQAHHTSSFLIPHKIHFISDPSTLSGPRQPITIPVIPIAIQSHLSVQLHSHLNSSSTTPGIASHLNSSSTTPGIASHLIMTANSTSKCEQTSVVTSPLIFTHTPPHPIHVSVSVSVSQKAPEAQSHRRSTPEDTMLPQNPFTETDLNRGHD